MSHFQGNDKIYEELKGYFPPEYDLTPEELEKEIELENKKREIALGMMRAHLSEEAEDGAEQKQKLHRSAVSAVATNHDRSLNVLRRKAMPTETIEIVGAEPVPEGVAVTEEYLAEPSEKKGPATTVETADFADTAAISIPVAEDVTENDLLNKYDSLDELFYQLEDDSAEDTQDKAEKETNFRKNVNWFFDFIEVFAICITCIIVVFALFFRLTKVTGESMEDTLYENEYLVVSDFMYEPKVGDIVVIQNTALTNELLREPLVKRVIAVGGQSVTIAQNGMVTVTYEDGTSEILDQSFTKKQPYAAISGHYTVPEGYVFVMGDNRNHSTDSRSPMVGMVDERCIFGKAIVRVLPFTEFTIFENPYNN